MIIEVDVILIFRENSRDLFVEFVILGELFELREVLLDEVVPPHDFFGAHEVLHIFEFYDAWSSLFGEDAVDVFHVVVVLG